MAVMVPSGLPRRTVMGEIEQGMALSHPCFFNGCKAVAPYGYGVKIRADRLGEWACEEHRPLLEAKHFPEAKAPPKPEPEGDLFS